MELSIVTEAVRTLRARNERMSIRSVHGLTGGSFRDLTKLLKDAAEFLAEDEMTELERDVSPMTQPSLGRIVETFQAGQLADHEAGVASAALNARREQLQDLVAHRPPPAVEPEDVSESVAARLDHEATVATLREEIGQLDHIVQAHMAEARALRVERTKLLQRAEELRVAILPSVRRTLAEAQHELEQRRVALAYAVELAQRQVARTQQSLVGYERELSELTGEQ